MFLSSTQKKIKFIRNNVETSIYRELLKIYDDNQLNEMKTNFHIVYKCFDLITYLVSNYYKLINEIKKKKMKKELSDIYDNYLNLNVKYCYNFMFSILFKIIFI